MKVSPCLLLLLFAPLTMTAQPTAAHGLNFDGIARRWDEGIPLGNGKLGALIWQKGKQLRISLDRADLWDERLMPDIDRLTFAWVQQKWQAGQYDSVQRWGDEPYEANAAPTKIPGAALEFDLNRFGEVVSNQLDIRNGLSTIRFSGGVVFNNYIHATRQTGYFGFEGLQGATVLPQLIIPGYHTEQPGATGNSVEGQGLQRLGYAAGTLTKTPNRLRYHQPCWNKQYYEVLVEWIALPNGNLIGQWTISKNQPAVLPPLDPLAAEPTAWPTHQEWWTAYWSRSSITIPDTLLEKQYYLEMYKFGAVARGDGPPISLQAIWTADNGNLPPWKGDFHHDLNTELSYWPGYTANHLDLTAGFTNWLWDIRKVNEDWTRRYFGKEGLNVPGVTTLAGKEMGGWIQYSMSPTTAAWLAQHFYWQWRYGQDTAFLKQRAIPYITAVARFLEQLSRSKGKWRKLPLSSSPEYHDNSSRAWFGDWTNYDLALTRYLFQVAAKLQTEIKQPRAAKKYTRLEAALPPFATNETGLQVAVGQNLDQSHRHHAQLMAIYPLGLLNSAKPAEAELISKSMRWLEKMGTRAWTGYSFSWAACLYAREGAAEKAVAQLRIFAQNFCAGNSFHLNGDQRGGQYSAFTYRPFTLEGNFAFAQGIHELMIRSDQGYVDVFPAVPDSWKEVSFSNLRTEGGFLVSAIRKGGQTKSVTIRAEQQGILTIKLPFKSWKQEQLNEGVISKNKSGTLSMELVKGQSVTFVTTEP